MHLRNLLFAVVAISIMGLSLGLTGQGLVDGIKVNLPFAVTVGDGDVVLDPGEYEIRRASTTQDQTLRIFSNDKMRWETNVITIPVLENKTPEDSKVVLYHIGDKYYFDKIWIEGKTYGYEFVLPDKAKALEKELAESIPARYEAVQVSQTTTTNDDEALAKARAEGDAAAKAEQDRLAQLEGERQAQDRQAQADRERESAAIAQAERDRQAQFQRDQQALADAQAERDRLAQLERERQTTVVAQVQRDEQPVRNEQPERLPATASNWAAFLLGGCALIGASTLLRLNVARSRE